MRIEDGSASGNLGVEGSIHRMCGLVCVAVPPASENAPRVSRRCAIETVLALIWLVRASWRKCPDSRDSGPTMTSHAVRTVVDLSSLDLKAQHPQNSKGCFITTQVLAENIMSCQGVRMETPNAERPSIIRNDRTTLDQPMMNLTSLEGSRLLISTNLGVDDSSTLGSRIRVSRNLEPNGGGYGDQN